VAAFTALKSCHRAATRAHNRLPSPDLAAATRSWFSLMCLWLALCPSARVFGGPGAPCVHVGTSCRDAERERGKREGVRERDARQKEERRQRERGRKLMYLQIDEDSEEEERKTHAE